MEKVVDFINDELGIDYDPEDFYTNPSNYVKHSYESCFLGSQGRRIGRFYGGVDDFSWLEPKYNNAFDVRLVTNNGEIINRGGRFAISIVDESHLDMTKTIYDNRYLTFWGDD